MSLVAAAVVPGAPLLVPELAGGSAHLDEPLRKEVLEVVQGLLDLPVGRLVVVGTAALSRTELGTWDWSSYGVRVRGAAAGPVLPASLALGAWLLDRCGAGPERTYVGVADTESPEACARLGQELALEDVRLLVVGDGSACRSEKAPGSLDPRAEPFDAAVADALAAGDPAALLALDAQVARELLAAGRAPWQVLAGAAGQTRSTAELRSATAPYGVGYVVATWRQDEARSRAGDQWPR